MQTSVNPIIDKHNDFLNQMLNLGPGQLVVMDIWPDWKTGILELLELTLDWQPEIVEVFENQRFWSAGNLEVLPIMPDWNPWNLAPWKIAENRFLGT